MMPRSIVRAVPALVLLTLAYDASAQTPGSLRRVGVIYPSGHHQVMVEGLREGLRELGLEEGKQLVLDARSVEGALKAALVTSQAQLIIDTARTKRLPTMFHETGLVERGALAAYGQNYREIGRLAAKLVQRILAGSAPKDLPVENYDKIGLALNLRTAREIGLTIPAAVRALADTVVE